MTRWSQPRRARVVVDGRDYTNPEAPDGFFLGVTLFDTAEAYGWVGTGQLIGAERRMA